MAEVRLSKFKKIHNYFRGMSAKRPVWADNRELFSESLSILKTIVSDYEIFFARLRIVKYEGGILSSKLNDI